MLGSPNNFAKSGSRKTQKCQQHWLPEAVSLMLSCSWQQQEPCFAATIHTVSQSKYNFATQASFNPSPVTSCLCTRWSLAHAANTLPVSQRRTSNSVARCTHTQSTHAHPAEAWLELHMPYYAPAAVLPQCSVYGMLAHCQDGRSQCCGGHSLLLQQHVVYQDLTLRCSKNSRTNTACFTSSSATWLYPAPRAPR